MSRAIWTILVLFIAIADSDKPAIAQRLVLDAKYKAPSLGIRCSENLQDYPKGGVRVDRLFFGCPAYSGIELGDIVTVVNGKQVNSPADVREALVNVTKPIAIVHFSSEQEIAGKWTRKVSKIQPKPFFETLCNGIVVDRDRVTDAVWYQHERESLETGISLEILATDEPPIIPFLFVRWSEKRPANLTRLEIKADGKYVRFPLEDVDTSSTNFYETSMTRLEKIPDWLG